MKADIFALLAEGATTDQLDRGLPTISLWGKTILYLMFFTLHPERFASHRDEDKRLVYLCAGDGCPACLAGIRATEHIYLPVWDAQNRRIAVLRFDTRPDGPARSLLGFLKLYQGQLADVVAVVDCAGDGKGTFSITARRPLPETDRGVLTCRAFCDGLETGTIDLRSCVGRLGLDEIAALPSVRRKATHLVGESVAPIVTVPTPPSMPIGESVAPNPTPSAAFGTTAPASDSAPMVSDTAPPDGPMGINNGGEGG